VKPELGIFLDPNAFLQIRRWEFRIRAVKKMFGAFFIKNPTFLMPE